MIKNTQLTDIKCGKLDKIVQKTNDTIVANDEVTNAKLQLLERNLLSNIKAQIK